MKVSVIIPVCNAEKFDDALKSFDAAIAESYLERFGGRMKIITLDKNTGSGSIPRNIGLEHARGEYVYFMDNDDLLIDNALEIFVEAADTYKADVVYTEG